MAAVVEHANVTVSDPQETAKWMREVFGWHIRWEGPAINAGYSIHVGTTGSYLALYNPGHDLGEAPASYINRGALNHLAVVVTDLDQTETAVKAAGFTPHNHQDYEPGRRFYFMDKDEIEYEVVEYDQ